MEPKANELPKCLVLINIREKVVSNVTSRPGTDHFSGPLHHRSTILSALDIDYALTDLFLRTSQWVTPIMRLPALDIDYALTDLFLKTSQWVTHHEIALARYSLNFGVPTESEASELPKGLAMWDLTIHPPQGPDVPVSTPQPRLGSDTNRHISGLLHHRSTILSALGPDYAFTILFLGTHTRTFQWVTHHGIALVRYSFNFRVPMESETSELSKGLVLDRDKNIHLRITPLGDVGSYIETLSRSSHS
ncbi:unnamed protein product [Malus baccata var. baccata]